MNEAHLLRVLSRLVYQQIEMFDHGLTDEQVQELAGQVAEGAWNGLILLLRENLATGSFIALHEFGLIALTAEGDYTFEPAASLAQAGSLSLPRDVGNVALAERAVFYLTESLRLVRTLSPMQAIETSPGTLPRKTLGEDLLRALVRGEVLGPEVLAKEVNRLGAVVHSIARQLAEWSSRRSPQKSGQRDSEEWAEGRIVPAGHVPDLGEKLMIHITEVDLSPDAKEILDFISVQTLGDLARLTREEIASRLGPGHTALPELEMILAAYGLRFGMLEKERPR